MTKRELEQLAKEYHEYAWEELNRDGGDTTLVDNLDKAFLAGFKAGRDASARIVETASAGTFTDVDKRVKTVFKIKALGESIDD
jgi:hypothetical protein